MAVIGTTFTIPPAVTKKYDMGDEIARGKYGVVFKCESKGTKEPHALKLMLKKGNKKEDVLREVDILKKISAHPGVLIIDDFIECTTEYILVTELLNGGELFDYVIAKEYLDENEATYYLKQILAALDFCHKKKIVHLDLKPENIVLKERDGKNLKIIDFGTAQDLNVNPRPQVMVGTPEFIAPEALNLEPLTAASDMWAIGVITYVLLTGMSPFLGDNDMETVNNIAEGEFEYPDPDPEEGYEDITDLAKKFIETLLIKSSSERGTAVASLKHEWLSSEQKDLKRIATKRLKSFRARRRWLAVIRAVRVSIGMMRGVGK